MKRLVVVHCFTVLILIISFSLSAKRPSDDEKPRNKAPKVRIVDELEKIRNKNFKKTKSNAESVSKFRSADFDQQYYIGGVVQQYAQSLLDKLISTLAMDYPDIHQELADNIQVYVVYDRTLNAHATRNNNILLTSQWIKDAGTEGEIVSLLAHELSHLILKHPDVEVDQEEKNRKFNGFLMVAQGAVTLANTKSKKNGKNTDFYQTKSGEKKIRNAEILGALMSDVKVHYISKKISRKNEEQADYLALELMEMANYDVSSSLKMLELLHDDESRTVETINMAESYLNLINPYFQQWVGKELQRLAGDDIVKLILAQLIQQHAAKVATKFTYWLKDKRRSHLKAGTRYFRVGDYIEKFELGEVGLTPPNDFQKIKQIVNEIYQELEHLELANHYIDVGQFNDAEKVLKEVNKLVSSKDPSLYQSVDIKQWIMRSKLRIAQSISRPKKLNDALENLCKLVLKFTEADCYEQDFKVQAQELGIIIPQDFFVLLAETYTNLKQTEKAYEVIDKGSEYYDEHPFHLHKVMLACQTKDFETFHTSLNLCQEYGVFDSAKFCGVIESTLKVQKQKAEKPLKEKNPFATVPYEKLNWWESCDIISNRPFSTVKSKKQITEIIAMANEMIEDMKLAEEVENNVKE